MRDAYRAVGKSERKRQLEIRMILKEILKNSSERMWIDFIC
jgi:hypothetical protein